MGTPPGAASPGAGARGLGRGCSARVCGVSQLTRCLNPGHALAADREPTPTFFMAPPPASTAAPAAVGVGGTPGARVRTAAKAHPLTPSRQVVLEEEEEVGAGLWGAVFGCLQGTRRC